MDEILLIDKPVGITSYDVIRRLKKKYPRKTKIGHAGTLDPMASGLLIIGIGKATKRLTDIVGETKEYVTEIDLSGVSTTGDLEGDISKIDNIKEPCNQDVENIVSQFVGEIEQIPSQYSAIKIDGKKAYEYARAGENVEIKPRKIIIDDIEVLKYCYPFLKIRVVCSKGTYIRNLGEDIGKKLGTGGYLTSLRRMKIGDYLIGNAEIL